MEGLTGKMSRVQVFNSLEEEKFFNDRIQALEHYQIKEQNSEYAWIEFDYKKCFPLSVFIEGLKTKYLRVYDGQLRLLAFKIYCHLKDLRNQNINHGNLEEKNIIIQVEDDSQNFTTYARYVEIRQIYFINYQLDQSKVNQDDDFLSINKIISILFNDRREYDPQKPQISENWVQLGQILNGKLNQVNGNQKIENLDKEDGYTSSRYIYQKNFANDLESIKKIWDELDNKIETEITQFKELDQDSNQYSEVLGEKAISIIKIQSNMEIQEVNEDDSNKQNEQDSQKNQINKLKQKINQAKCELHQKIKYLFLNRFYEEAVIYQMKGIGEYLSSPKYLAKYSNDLSNQSINQSFVIQLNNFKVLFKQITSLETNFNSIFNELIDRHFDMFKFQIDLDPQEILGFHINQTIKFILYNQLIERQKNWLGDASFQEFENNQKEILRSSISELISLLQQIQILKIISELI